MSKSSEENIVSMIEDLYAARVKSIFASLLDKEGIREYPWYDLGSKARTARSKKDALWKEHKADIEAQALDSVRRNIDRLPAQLRERILRDIQGPAYTAHRPVPRCSLCGEEIRVAQGQSIQEIQKSDGTRVAVAPLEPTRYQGWICRNCGRIYCSKCHDVDVKGASCPNCGQAVLPLYADMLSHSTH